MPAREAQLREWLSHGVGLADYSMQPASDDASFRRYFRVQKGGGTSLIAMDAPPSHEDVEPFLRIAGMLAPLGIHVPAVHASDASAGFVLLEDLGSCHYLDKLDKACADGLYNDAMAALLKVQSAGVALDLPPYDETMLRREMELFDDWLVERYLEISLMANQRSMLDQLQQLLVANALEQPVVAVLRDYHSRNLLVVPDNNPGVIDFQDAVNGPITYDLVSLLKDCYIRWPRQQVLVWVRQYHASLTGHKLIKGVDEQSFLRWFDLMGVQRQLKASGIFARLYLRDGKGGYLKDIPRTLGYIRELGAEYGELAPLVELIEAQVLPGLQAKGIELVDA